MLNLYNRILILFYLILYFSRIFVGQNNFLHSTLLNRVNCEKQNFVSGGCLVLILIALWCSVLWVPNRGAQVLGRVPKVRIATSRKERKNNNRK